VPGLEVPWLQPLPDAFLPPAAGDPSHVAVERASVRLALVAAIQLLPPRQRAVLILREALDFSAAEVASMLDTSVAAVHSARQRGRARLAGVDLRAELQRAPDPAEQRLVDRYVEAFERADVAGLVRLLTADAVLEMPPLRNWFVGREAYAAFMAGVFERRGTDWRTLPTRANGQPAIAAYLRVGDRYQLHTLQVLSADHGLLDRTTVFQDVEVLATFDLPPTLPRDDLGRPRR
jgi:RNA polymerase sigma-70 factor, ECF subfamily